MEAVFLQSKLFTPLCWFSSADTILIVQGPKSIIRKIQFMLCGVAVWLSLNARHFGILAGKRVIGIVVQK